MPPTLLTLAAALTLAFAACGSESRPPRPVTGSAPAPAPVATASISLSAAATPTALELTLRNEGAAAVTIASHVSGGSVDHLDWLAVELDGPGGKRTLRFSDARNASTIVTAALAPGAAATERVDLTQWAIRAGNGEPLAPGSYQVRATWDASKAAEGATFVATAATTVTIDPPGPGGCERDRYQAPAGAKLMLLGHQAKAGRASAHVGLYNAGTAAVCVYSHIKTHEIQNDWLTIQYSDGAKYHHISRVIELDDARDKSYPVSVLLGPGQSIWHTVDVDAWASRARNHGEPLPAGSLYTQAAYDSTRETRVWSGKLISEHFELRVPT